MLPELHELSKWMTELKELIKLTLFTKEFGPIRRYFPLLNRCASERIPRGGETRFGKIRPGFFFALSLTPLQFPKFKERIDLIHERFCRFSCKTAKRLAPWHHSSEFRPLVGMRPKTT